ncbi:MAG TPA: hypothetical protein VHF07_02565 [Nitrospiraceae bacterium]|nr:hypothetical protein [Nitrospiraceae bacterium]
MKLITKYKATLAVGLSLALTVAISWAQPDQSDTFHPHDVRVFKAAACTKDRKPVEALYYIAASRSDLAQGKPSPSAGLMKEQVEANWRQIAARLTGEQVMAVRFAETYHAVLSEFIPRLEHAVEKQSGVSITVSEVNSRPMDAAKDKDVPVCGLEQ